jgi:hypothetical protein
MVKDSVWIAIVNKKITGLIYPIMNVNTGKIILIIILQRVINVEIEDALIAVV